MALALTTIGATTTVAANESRVTFVNGVPATAIDICLNGKEVKSGLPYGAVISRIRNNGSHVVKVYAKDPRKCRGTRLGQTTLDLNYEDLTVVATKSVPKIVVFDDTTLTAPAPSGVVAWRNASDLGPISVKYVIPGPIAPAVDPVWAKGDQFTTSLGPDTALGVLITRPDQQKVMAGPKFQTVGTGRRYEQVVVGNKAKNARIVTFDRAFWPVP